MIGELSVVVADVLVAASGRIIVSAVTKFIQPLAPSVAKACWCAMATPNANSCRSTAPRPIAIYLVKRCHQLLPNVKKQPLKIA